MRVTGAAGYDCRTGAHQFEQLRRKNAARNTHPQRNQQAEHNGLYTGDGRVFRVFFADAARDHGGG
jgi:hypothetical protein